MYGNGKEFNKTKEYIVSNRLESYVYLHGNQLKDVVKQAYKESHFLIFISKSEGWPKVVAEAMFWGCLPIASNVSCVEDMLGYGNRGAILNASSTEKEVVEIIKEYLKDKEIYKKEVELAKNWSQKYTLDRFENEIKNFL